ncbi:MAG: cyclic nucleotide-binding domain-containing protein [Methylacidiphilales bacterium]|nr:cyclic nucleotide-binding domain-containing protein [Candidatus Methylacidiphilales bacterium]
MEHNFEANFFTLMELLDQTGRLEVDSACSKVSFPPDTVIYKQGDPATSVYIIVSGIVEAFTLSLDGLQSRSVGVMGKGDFFGDLAVLTGQPRLAGIRTREATKLLQIEKLAFIKLLEKVPKLGAYFSRNLARRLHQTSTEAYVKIFLHDLTGNLQHFDLLTIFQAITSTGRSGELHLTNSDNDLIGSFFFSQGRAVNARYLHLTGTEAIWQGFLRMTAPGTFVFRVMEASESQFTDETKLDVESVELLMQGASRRDTFNALPEYFREMKARLSRVGETLSWTDEASRPLAERLWELIAKRPQPLDSLWRRLPYSSLTFLETVSILANSGQTELLSEEPAGESSAPAPAPPGQP